MLSLEVILQSHLCKFLKFVPKKVRVKICGINMKKKVVVWTVVLGVILGWSVFYFWRQPVQLSVISFPDEPVAHALYDKMIETMRTAESLSYESNYKWDAASQEMGCTYTIWMKKPNYFRVEATGSKGEKGGIIIGDGDFLWVYWPGQRPMFSSEDAESYQKSKTGVYIKEAAPVGKHSIGHKMSLLGVHMLSTIIDPMSGVNYNFPSTTVIFTVTS